MGLPRGSKKGKGVAPGQLLFRNLATYIKSSMICGAHIGDREILADFFILHVHLQIITSTCSNTSTIRNYPVVH
jgi:hypothetical protein